MLRNTDAFNYYNNPIIDNAQNKFNIYANNTFQNNLNSKFNIPKSKSSLYFREEQAPRANNSPPILKYNSSSLLNNPPNHSFSVSSFPSTINVIPPNSQIPPVSINGKKTLILDIDETLVHSSFFPFIRSMKLVLSRWTWSSKVMNFSGSAIPNTSRNKESQKGWLCPVSYPLPVQNDTNCAAACRCFASAAINATVLVYIKQI